MAKNEKVDYGGFGRGVDKRGRTYYYESNKNGGFGIKPITEDKFKKMLKEKIRNDKAEARKVKASITRAKNRNEKNRLKEEEKLRQERLKASEEAIAAWEKKLEESKQKRKDAGIENKPSLTDSQQAKIKLNDLNNRLMRDMDHVSEERWKLLEKYNELSQNKYYKVVSGRLLRLSTEYNKLYSDMDKLSSKLKRGREYNIGLKKQVETFLTQIDKLDVRLGTLMIEVEKTEDRVEKEEALRDQKEADKRNKIDKRLADKQARDQARQSNKAAKDKIKADKERRKETRKRRLEIVATGRAKQSEERQQRRDKRIELVATGRAKQEEMKQIKIEALRIRNQKVNRFFDLGRSPVLFAGSKVGGLAGNVLGGIGNTLGMDFSQEGSILSKLFSPIKALSGLGYKGLKSFTQSKFGVNDLDKRIEEIETSKPSIKNPGKGKTNSQKSPLFSIKQGLAGLTSKTNNAFSSTKNFVNGRGSSNSYFNKSNNVSNSSNATNTTNSTSNDKFQNTDFNRSDDNIDKELVSPIVDLLDKILKEIKKGNDEKKKGNLFGGGLGKAGLYGAAAVGAVVLGKHIVNQWRDMSQDNVFNHNKKNNAYNSNTSNTKQVLINKLTSKNASKGDIEEFGNLLDEENRINNNLPERDLPYVQKKLKDIQERKKEIIKKNFNNSSNVNNTSNSDSVSNFKSSDSVVMKAQGTKVEKIKDIKDDPNERMDRLQKWFSDIFIPKMADAIATSISTKRGTGKSIMPPVDPF